MAKPNALHVIPMKPVSFAVLPTVKYVMDSVETVICFFALVEGDEMYKGVYLKCKSSGGVLDHTPVYAVIAK